MTWVCKRNVKHQMRSNDRRRHSDNLGATSAHRAGFEGRQPFRVERFDALNDHIFDSGEDQFRCLKVRAGSMHRGGLKQIGPRILGFRTGQSRTETSMIAPRGDQAILALDDSFIAMPPEDHDFRIG